MQTCIVCHQPEEFSRGGYMSGWTGATTDELFEVIRTTMPEDSPGRLDRDEYVDVIGTSKGKGFQGVIRRHKFAGHTATHGTHESFRGPGSVGGCAYPGRIFKGKRMEGHMGAVRRTIQNLEVVAIRADDGVLLVRGGLPGSRGERVILRPAVKRPVR